MSIRHGTSLVGPHPAHQGPDHRFGQHHAEGRGHHGQWHKVICQRSGGTLSVSVDDVVRGQIAIPATLNITNKLPLRLGGPNFNTKTDMYHGRLDDVYAELG